MTIPQAFHLAIQRHQAGELAEAEALYRKILEAEPNNADAMDLLGVIAGQRGRHDLAVEWMRKAIKVNPAHSAAHHHLGESSRAMGRWEEAIAAFRRSIELRSDEPKAHANLGGVLAAQGQFGEAANSFRRAIELKPNWPEIQLNLGVAMAMQGRLDEAVAAFRRTIELRPDYPEAHFNLGNAFNEQGRLDEAVSCYRGALELRPDYADAHANLGNALNDQGRLDEALEAYRRAMELKPEHAGVHSNLIYSLHFHPAYDYETISEEQARWNRRFGDPLKAFIPPHANDPATARPLRIGYVSPDFRDHVVGRNLMPLFRRHDRRSFEVLCYSDVVRPDAMTEAFRRHANEWRNTAGVGDEMVAEMIRRDRVDILVDLTQHMAGNRLPMFARKPAPVQVSFAGYPERTGLEAIKYRISDRYLEAGGARQGARSQERVWLIDSFWCYDPCGAEGEVNELPAKESGRVTFGCLNNFCKVNELTLRLWARALGRVSGSRLILLCGVGSHRQQTLDVLEREGVEAGRVEFVEPCPRRQYLELYHRLDVVVDTFPYNGHTTSLDALWMGVPVVSLIGDTAVSRAGLSQSTNLGLRELAAHSEEEFVRVAVDLAGNLPRLAELRATLRERMRASPLMDGARFARNVEGAYREMWRAWSLEQTVKSGG